MNIARTVASAFGGPRALARALGHKFPTTVYYWVETGLIPTEHWPAIEVAAADVGADHITAEWIGQQTGKQVASDRGAA